MKSAKRKPHSTSLILLLICIFAFWWGISLLVQPVSTPAPSAAPSAALSQPQAAAPLLVYESISGQTHTYSGTYMPSSLCGSFGSGIRYSAASGGHVSVLLITEPAGADCAQAAGTNSGEPFSVSIKLKAGSAPIFDGVLLNGSPISAELQPAN